MAGFGPNLGFRTEHTVLAIDMEHRQCRVCDKVLTYHQKMYCSRSCRQNAESRVVVCEHCGKEFRRAVSWLVYDRVFCSAPCRTGGMRLTTGLSGLVDGQWHLPLVGGGSTLVDEDSYAEYSSNRWYSFVGRTTSYVCRPGGNHGKTRLVLHRLIMDAPPELVVDHINCNGLDNRRSNLRLVEHSVNCLNNRGHKRRASRYKGVHKYKHLWEAELKVNGVRYRFGRFQDQEAAARAYDDGARSLLGSIGRYNFPLEGEQSALWEP